MVECATRDDQNAQTGSLLTFRCILLTRLQKKSSVDMPSVARMVEDVLGCKWSLHVLELIESGVRRPGAMERAVAGLSAKVLNERLVKLTRFGIVRRTTYPEVPPRVEYELTDFGRRFSGILAEIRRLQESFDADVDRASQH